jgi:hypothetical protein
LKRNSARKALPLQEPPKMKEYLGSCFGKQGIVKVVYAWTWLDVKAVNYVCLVDGFVAKQWGEDHPHIRDFNGLKVLDVISTYIRMKEITPLEKELL